MANQELAIRVYELEQQIKRLNETIWPDLSGSTAWNTAQAMGFKNKEPEGEDRELYGEPIDLEANPSAVYSHMDGKPLRFKLMLKWRYDTATGKFWGTFRTFLWQGEGWWITAAIEEEITYAEACAYTP